MTAPTNIPDSRVRLTARTWRGVLALVGLFAAAAGLSDVAFALGYDWSGWLLATGPAASLVGTLIVLGSTTEWTVDGRTVLRRPWLSRPGSQPVAVMELGPHLEIVHESRYRWRLLPYGPALDAYPWRGAALADAMERAGVRVTDPRREWERRHRPLATAGTLAPFAGIAGLFAGTSLGLATPYSSLVIAAFACLVLMGAGVDRMPGPRQAPSAHAADRGAGR